MATRQRLSLRSADRKILQALFDELEISFRESKRDRTLLHEQEWLSSEESHSVLGEAEIRSDFVAGIALTWLARGIDDSHRTGLVENSLHRSLALHCWYKDNAADYPEFAAYLQAIEHLRAVEFRTLQRGGVEPDPSPDRP